VILFAVVLSQYTRVTDDRRQTTSYEHSGTLQFSCDVPLKMGLEPERQGAIRRPSMVLRRFRNEFAV